MPRADQWALVLGKAAALVTRCVCFDVTLSELKALSDADGSTIIELNRDTGCGGRCGLCIPYIKLMLQTGDTRPPVMWSGKFREAGVHPAPIDQLERRLGLDSRGHEIEHTSGTGSAAS
ncbi:MAG: (2Fe-2S)-binding protein [Planctomycetota bacterium]